MFKVFAKLIDGVFRRLTGQMVSRYATQNLHIWSQGIPDSPRSKQRVARDTARRFAAKLGAAGAVPSSW